MSTSNLHGSTNKPLYGERLIEDSKIICFENPNKEVKPVTNVLLGSGLNKQIAILEITTKTDNAGNNRFILLT